MSLNEFEAYLQMLLGDDLISMKVPDEHDWGEIDPNDLDANHAFKQFFGKSFEEAIVLFEQNALFYQEDLQSMPATVFNFYAPAFAEYLNAEKSKGDSDGASSFLHMFMWMLREQREIMNSDVEQLLFETAKQIAGKQEFYQADVDIYGSFSALWSEIKNLMDSTE